MSENETRTLVELSLAVAAEAFARLAEATQGLAEEDLEAVIDGLLEERDTSDDRNGIRSDPSGRLALRGVLDDDPEPARRLRPGMAWRVCRRATWRGRAK